MISSDSWKRKVPASTGIVATSDTPWESWLRNWLVFFFVDCIATSFGRTTPSFRPEERENKSGSTHERTSCTSSSRRPLASINLDSTNIHHANGTGRGRPSPSTHVRPLIFPPPPHSAPIPPTQSASAAKQLPLLSFSYFCSPFCFSSLFFLFGTKSSGSNSPPTTISAIWLAAGLSRFHFGYFSLPPRLCRCWLVRSCCSNAIGPFVLIFIEIHSIVDTNETFKNPSPFHALKI